MSFSGKSSLLSTAFIIIIGFVNGNNNYDFRNVSYEELLPELYEFSEDGVRDFSEILFDFPRYQVIVGARDALYRLSLEGLTKLEKATWEAKYSTVGLCTAKGQSEADCRNFIKVLVAHEDQIFACGTNAYSPKCSWRPIEEINGVNEWVDGRGKCPYGPHSNVTALMTSKKEYYIASAIDFSSTDHAIYRMSDNDGSRGRKSSFGTLLRTAQYDAKWLAQPNFVGVFETAEFVYFVFRETAVEFINCGKAVYSRIARVCKNNDGGYKDNWTTFLKARLNCSIPGEYPFYYNEVQSMFYLEEDSVVYATFSTGDNSIYGSAICSFNLSAVRETFRGPFKSQSRSDSTWEAYSGDHSHFECRNSNTQTIPTSRDYQLLDKAVQPSISRGPLFKENLERYTHIVVESVRTKYQDNDPVHVIFVATREGILKKLSYNTRNQKTCLVEVLQPFISRRDILIRNMKFLAATNSLYLTTTEKVLRIPTQRCRRFKTKKDCLNAMDPYCGWNKQKNECTPTPNKNPRAAYWQQNPMTCPVLTDSVDGKWGSWSEWFKCDYRSGVYFRNGGGSMFGYDNNEDHCMCKRRKCDNPPPANGGSKCSGSELEVRNCTQHGGWTEWSEWSACSKTCDIGMKQKRRICGNPAPAFGGRVCVGRDVVNQICDDLPPCTGVLAAPASAPLIRTNAGSWAPWSQWSPCSSECGPGFTTRTRKCYGGVCSECSGGGIQYKECESKKCSDLMVITDWTPWVKGNISVGGTWSEKRFRFSYKAPVTLREAGHIIEEERLCRGAGRCSEASTVDVIKGSAELWSDWSKCTKECGGGYQLKIRSCPPGQYGCTGMTVAERPCNTHPCPGEWGCWSSWSGCDGRTGKKTRTRICKSENGSCEGPSYVEDDCDGWGSWGDFTPCDPETGLQTRHRTCLFSDYLGCVGSDKDTRMCNVNIALPVIPPPLYEERATYLSIKAVVAAAVCGFVVGACLGGAAVFYFIKYKRPLLAGGGSPHYVSAKSQNLYVSLPMLDLKHKHLAASAAAAAAISSSSNQSDCGTIRSTTTGTLRSAKSSIYGSSRPEYETATIKRSHSHRNSSLINGGPVLGGGPNSLRADLDSDQLFN